MVPHCRLLYLCVKSVPSCLGLQKTHGVDQVSSSGCWCRCLGVEVGGGACGVHGRMHTVLAVVLPPDNLCYSSNLRCRPHTWSPQIAYNATVAILALCAW